MKKHRAIAAMLVMAGTAYPAYSAAPQDEPKQQLGLGQTAVADVCAGNGALHVASPEWRDQIIYFLMLDRFADGDPSNNDQGMGEYNPADPSRYSGGDIKGVTSRLDYIKSLGATTVWTTPPIANQWWSQVAGYGGYHGYWARDFTKIDEHYGDISDYQQLSCGLHRRDMYLVMDIVVNHTGDFFNYDQASGTADPAAGYRPANPNSPSSAPLSYPFNLNDPRREKDREAAIYNWTGELSNYGNREAETTQQLSKLDDINTKNPAVRKAFKDIFGDWISNAGVDGFRVDTVKYVEPEFFEDFLYAPDGILKRAENTGRKDFFVFGEVKENAPAFSLISEAKMQEYFGPRPLFPSLINFPLQEEMLRVFAQGLPTSAMTYRLEAMKRTNPDPTLAANFVDNHDMPRFLSQGSIAGFKQALAMIFTLPGVPMIYQGNEQGEADTRAAMFKGGYGADKDRFDTQSDLFQFIQKMAEIRKAHTALRRGELTVLADNKNMAGAFAFRRDGEDGSILVIINSADHPSLLTTMPAGLVPFAELTPVFGPTGPAVTAGDGSLTMELAPREIRILKLPNDASAGEAIGATAPRDAPHIIIDTPLPNAPLDADYQLSGRWTGSDKMLQLVIDGDLSNAQNIPVAPGGKWAATLSAGDIGTHDHLAQIYAPQSGIVGPEIPYETQRNSADWEAQFSDPKYDDKGPDGDYAPPTDPGFRGQQDFVGAHVRTGGDILEVELQMRATGADWSPANGFDHVSFTNFFELPGRRGLTRSVDIDGPMPRGFSWSAMHSIFGWGNSMKMQDGQKIGRAPSVSVNHAKRTITLSYRASSLGLKSWKGVRIYFTSFDREGEGATRKITREGGPMVFRGDPAGPKVMDDMLIEIP
ncbi:alpha-amylase family glycosyl hydrolase [Sphingorhabdus arenilitoris]|uniref:Alpha-amylase family glycosyl hydrolase n=1 Tax=Sphingorhabdus arenilitoris TaxID=1490041 RepID=A0ABV8RDX8_9SPHN